MFCVREGSYGMRAGDGKALVLRSWKEEVWCSLARVQQAFTVFARHSAQIRAGRMRGGWSGTAMDLRLRSIRPMDVHSSAWQKGSAIHYLHHTNPTAQSPSLSPSLPHSPSPCQQPSTAPSPNTPRPPSPSSHSPQEYQTAKTPPYR